MAETDAAVWSGDVDTSWYDNDTTAESFTITNAAQLAGLAQLVNNGNTTFKGKTITLGADIDLNNEEWTPIGKQVETTDADGKKVVTYYPFSGTFNGNGYTISNLTINDANLVNAGLFGLSRDGGMIDHVTVSNVSIKAAKYAGAIAGNAYTSTVQNCSVTGNVRIEGNDKVGGIVGHIYSNLTNCSVNAEGDSFIKGTYRAEDYEGDNVGGIVGYIGEGSMTLSGCSVSGVAVSGVRKVGGISGNANYGNKITNCTVVNTTVGYNAESVPDTYTKGGRSIGGLVGEVQRDKDNKVPIVIKDSSLSDVTVTPKEDVENGCGQFIGAVRVPGTSDIVNVLTATDEIYNTIADVVTVAGLTADENSTAEGATGIFEDGKLDANVQIGDKYYRTLKDAVDNVQAGNTITLLNDLEGCGINVPQNSKFTLDFNGHTYKVTTGPLAGSTGTENQAFQLLKGSTLTFKNGTITGQAGNLPNTTGRYSALAMLIQNYSNLTLENMTLDASEIPNVSYVMSNNCGNTTLTGETSILAAEGNVAFDVYYWPDGGYESVSVVLDERMTGTVDGKIEIDSDEDTVPSGNATLEIKAGTIKGEIAPSAKLAETASEIVEVSGGTFSEPVDASFCAENFAPVANTDGSYTVLETKEDNLAKALTVKFVEHEDNERVYDIVITPTDDTKYVNRLSAAELKFVLDMIGDGAIGYKITPADNVNMLEKDGAMEFNFDGVEDVSDGTGTKVKIGEVAFEGYGKFNFACVNYTDAKVNTAKISDNIVNTFTPSGDALTTGKLVLNGANGTIDTNSNDAIIKDKELKAETGKLTINVTFPNDAEDQANAYQQMEIKVSGGDLTAPIVIPLGSDISAVDTITKEYKTINGVNGYEVVITDTLTKGIAYNVEVTGKGYRTARYTVQMNSDKVLTFWNNVMDNAQTIETGVTDVNKKVFTTFLAGDIVKDNNINLYDLSAVVSYFGETGLSVDNHKEYAQYDLNRDGVIDSKDIAYVLVSWGK